MNELDSNYRVPSTDELKLLEKLLDPTFRGKDLLKSQLENITVCTIDEEGSLSLKVDPAHKPAPNDLPRVPVEGEYFDDFYPEYEYQPAVRILLHVVSGFLTEMEIYKDDGKPIKKFTDLNDVQITAREPINE